MRWIYPFVLLILLSTSVKGQIEISFEEIEILLINRSPMLRIINNNFVLIEKERDKDLQWSNPEFEFETERMKHNSEKETETVYTLQKQFEMPWIYSKRKDIWDSRLTAASFEREKDIDSFIAEMKTGYIELSLLADQRKDVTEIKTMLEKIYEIASLQHEEGAISGFEQNLIQMSLTSIETEIIELNERQMSIESEWKSSAGIERTSGIELISQITFQSVKPALLNEVISGVNNFSGIRANEEIGKALKNSLQLEAMSFFPEITLGGGYKEMTGGLKGFVLGVSVPIPLMNQNGARKEMKEIEFEQFEDDFNQYRDRLAGKVETLRQSIQSYEKSLQKYFSNENKLKMGLEQITSSYNEGWISLSDMLNAISIYYGHIEAVNEQMINYYKSVFTLESIIGKSLVTF